MTYPTQLVELIEEFQDIEDQMERLEMVFEMADEVVVLPTESWSDKTRIVGCQSEAHVDVMLQEGKVLIDLWASSRSQSTAVHLPKHCCFLLTLRRKWGF